MASPEREKALETALTRSKNSLAKARDEARPELDFERREHPDRLARRWMWRWASAACRAAESLRFTGRKARVKPPLPYISLLRRRRPEARRCSSTSSIALDPVYAKALGVDIDSLLVSQPDTGEQALEICEALVRSGAIDVVVIDSVAAMVTKAEIEGEMGDTHVGLQARLMSQALRKLTGAISKSNCVAIFINQLRENRRDVWQP